MKLQIDNKTYNLNTQRAVELGVLREEVITKLELTSDEVAVLYRILGSVGGDPNFARGMVDSVRTKLSKNGIPDTNLDLSFEDGCDGLFFKK